MDIKSFFNTENNLRNKVDNNYSDLDKRAEVNKNKDTSKNDNDSVDKRIDVNNKTPIDKSSHDTPDDRVKPKEHIDAHNDEKSEIKSYEKDFIISKEPIEVDDNKIGTAKENKEKGTEREHKFDLLLALKYPKILGYEVMSERVLRDKNGNIVKDSQTNSARRIDFIVSKNGVVINSFEVTSKTAPKNEQMAKEYRIKENGGQYVKDSNGNLLRIPNNVQTNIVRMK